MRTIAVANQKGGCGKTITSINLRLSSRARSAGCCWDMDPQGHATLGLLAAAAASPSRTMYEVFSRRAGKSPRVFVRSSSRSREPRRGSADILLSAIPKCWQGSPGGRHSVRRPREGQRRL